MTTKITFLRSIILFITICISTSIYALTFSTTKTDVYCNGDNTGSITVSVGDAVGTCYYSLTQDFASQQTNNTFENLGAGTYTVYVKDDNGIVGPDNVTILEPSKLEITDFSTTSSVCNDGKIAIEVAGGSAPYYYSLDGFATQQPSKTFDSLAEGEYTVYVKDNNGCKISTAANSVKVNPLTVNPLTQKPAANVVCKADKTASVTFTVVGRTEVIARADTASYYRVELFDITNQHEVIAPDLKFTNKFHPVLTKNRVEKEPVLDANGDPTFDDEGNLITKNVTYKDTLWTEGCHEPTKVQEVLEMSKISYTEDLKGFNCDDKISVSSLGAGAYKIRFYRGTCQIGEEMTFTVGITGSIPSVQINNVGSFCDESEYTITPTIVSTPIVRNYKWTLDDVVIREGQIKNAQEVVDSINLKRIFTLDDNNKALKLEIKNQCGSSISNIVKTKVNKRPTALIEANTDICRKNQPTDVSITLTGAGPFIYTLPDGTEKTVTDVYLKEEVIPVKDTIFTLISLKDANCEAQIDKDINAVETKIYPEPEYDMTINVPEPMISGRYVKVDATEGFAAYTLYINEDEIPAKGPENIFWVKKFPYGMSTNDFKMTFTDENGCDWTLEETQVIESIIFPNVFTPNGDGVNDIFLADYDLKVYDRQGTLMYEGTEGWDGTHNGVEANPGVYLYTLFIPTEDGNLEVIKSTLTLER